MPPTEEKYAYVVCRERVENWPDYYNEKTASWGKLKDATRYSCKATASAVLDRWRKAMGRKQAGQFRSYVDCVGLWE